MSTMNYEPGKPNYVELHDDELETITGGNIFDDIGDGLKTIGRWFIDGCSYVENALLDFLKIPDFIRSIPSMEELFPFLHL